MMEPYATITDIETLWRALTDAEKERAEALLPLVSDSLRQRAFAAGKDLDAMIEKTPTLASVAKVVTVDIIGRILRQSTTGEPMTQESQSGLGYSWSGSYAIPGGGIENSILYSDLKALGIKRQQIGALKLWERSKEHQ